MTSRERPTKAGSMSKEQRQNQRFAIACLAFLGCWAAKTAWMHSQLIDFGNSRSVLPSTSFSERRLMNHARNPLPLLWTNKQSSQVEKTDKKGNKVFHSITKLSVDNLQNINATDEESSKTLSLAEASKGRERLLGTLHDAGVHDIEPSVMQQLPLWNQVAALYYTDANGNDVTDQGPVVVGLDTCEAFRNTIPMDDASIGVAGLFNTGTNPAAMYLAANCEMPENKRDKGRGMRWQVPWGKHMIASRKFNNTAKHDTNVNKTNVLPIVLIRDPMTWMQSMCKHPYAANWEHSDEHCPNLVNAPVSIKYPGQKAHWDSLVELWSDWYNQYLQADYPRLLVRFEDMVFRPKEVVNEVCHCAGAVAKHDSFEFVVDAGKWGSSVHAGSSNMITAMMKYGTDQNRLLSLTSDDISYASQHLDDHLLHLFQYQRPLYLTEHI